MLYPDHSVFYAFLEDSHAICSTSLEILHCLKLSLLLTSLLLLGLGTVISSVTIPVSCQINGDIQIF